MHDCFTDRHTLLGCKQYDTVFSFSGVSEQDPDTVLSMLSCSAGVQV